MDAEKKENTMEIYAISSQSPEKTKIGTKRKWWHIDKEMLRFKIHFFMFIGALGTSLPFLTVFAKNRIGLSATSVAAILTFQQFLVIFTKPLIGFMADYFNKLKAIIGILTVIQTIFLFLMLTIPKINNLQTLENEHENHLALYALNISDPYEICKLEENKTFLKNDAYKSMVFCSFNSYKQVKLDNECVQIILRHSNDTFLKTEATSVTEVNSSEIHNELIGFINPNASNTATICSLCCKATEDCYLVSCPDYHNSSGEILSGVIDSNEFQTYQFWIYALITTFAMVSINALFTLSDTACCESVVKTGADFGRQRLYGAVGWGTMAPVGGLLHDYTGDYILSWIVTGVMLALSLWNLWKLDLVKPQFSQNILKDVGKVLSSKEFLAFEAGVFMNGIFTGIMWFYLIWFLTTIGASRFLCGLVQTVQCFIGEIPFMFYSGWMIKKVGHFNVLTLSLAAYCVRFCWYSYLKNPWLVLPMECAHGFTYGVFYAAVASYAKLSAKPGTEATTQSILFCTFEGLGAGLGCVLAGVGFDKYGGHETFFFASISAGCAMVISLIFSLCVRKKNKSITVTSLTPVQTSEDRR